MDQLKEFLKKIKIYDDNYEFEAKEVRRYIVPLQQLYRKYKHDFDVELQFSIDQMMANYYFLYIKKSLVESNTVPDLNKLQFSDAEELANLIVPKIRTQ